MKGVKQSFEQSQIKIQGANDNFQDKNDCPSTIQSNENENDFSQSEKPSFIENDIQNLQKSNSNINTNYTSQFNKRQQTYIKNQSGQGSLKSLSSLKNRQQFDPKQNNQLVINISENNLTKQAITLQTQNRDSQIKKSGIFEQAQQQIQVNSNNKNNNQTEVQLLEIIRNIRLKHIARRFANKIPTRMFKSLNPYHYNLIADKATFYKSIKNNKYVVNNEDDDFETEFQKIKEKEKKRSEKKKSCSYKILEFFGMLPIIQPKNVLKLIWDIGQLILILFYFTIILMYIAFDLQFEDFFGLNFIYGTIVYFQIDIVLNLNTGYFEQGLIVLKRKKIMLNYFKHGILVDIFCVIILIIQVYVEKQDEYGYRYLFLLFYVKITQFKLIYKRLEMRFQFKKKQQNYLQLFNLFIMVLWVNHIFACIWVYVPKIQKQNVNWMIDREIVDAYWQVQYLHSYYFAAITMITVGFGDVKPINNGEIFLCIVNMLIACGVFAYCVSEIGVIVDNLKQDKKLIKQKMTVINNYMQEKSIKYDLQYQIREYLQFFWAENNQQDAEIEESIINSLSHKLKEQLMVESNKLVLGNSEIFSKHFSEKIMYQTIPLIKEQRCTPEEFIFKNKDFEDQCIYFIEKGSVELYVEQKISKNETQVKSIQILNSGQHFGEVSFFTGQPRTLNARSLDFTTLLKVDRFEFLQLLSNHSLDLEKYCFIKDIILFQSNYSKIQGKCQSCISQYHQMNECPLIHYQPSQLNVILKYNHNPGQPQRVEGFLRRVYLRVDPQKNENLLRKRQQSHQQYQNTNQSQDSNAQIQRSNISFLNKDLIMRPNSLQHYYDSSEAASRFQCNNITLIDENQTLSSNSDDDNSEYDTDQDINDLETSIKQQVSDFMRLAYQQNQETESQQQSNITDSEVQIRNMSSQYEISSYAEVVTPKKSKKQPSKSILKESSHFNYEVNQNKGNSYQYIKPSNSFGRNSISKGTLFMRNSHQKKKDSVFINKQQRESQINQQFPNMQGRNSIFGKNIQYGNEHQRQRQSTTQNKNTNFQFRKQGQNPSYLKRMTLAKSRGSSKDIHLTDFSHLMILNKEQQQFMIQQSKQEQNEQLEVLKIYEIYLPQNNIENVLLNYKKYRKFQITRQKKKDHNQRATFIRNSEIQNSIISKKKNPQSQNNSFLAPNFTDNRNQNKKKSKYLNSNKLSIVMSHRETDYDKNSFIENKLENSETQFNQNNLNISNQLNDISSNQQSNRKFLN